MSTVTMKKEAIEPVIDEDRLRTALAAVPTEDDEPDDTPIPPEASKPLLADRITLDRINHDLAEHQAALDDLNKVIGSAEEQRDAHQRSFEALTLAKESLQEGLS